MLPHLGRIAEDRVMDLPRPRAETLYTYSVLGVVPSEMIAAVRGIGQDVVLYSTSCQINTVFAIPFIIMAVAAVIVLVSR
jgi:ABC-type nitrate/sulfonate/bicarbonate transport system permease component